MEFTKMLISGMNELGRNVFRFLPFVGPKKFTGKQRCDNKVIIVTGGNSGVGKEAAREFAARGAKVIIACRSVERGQEAADQLNNDERVKANGKVYFKQLDLASFESIRKFVDEINNEEEAIDILVNNAGVMLTPQDAKTKEGFEMHFGVNHLGHFLLTMLLLEKLKQSKSIARIVVVGSGIYYFGKMDFDDINFEKRKWNPWAAYSQSKLANILFTRELAERLHGTNIRVYCMHPSAVKTNLGRDDEAFKRQRRMTMAMYITPELACQTILYCALNDKLANESGQYYGNCNKYTNESCSFTYYLASNACDEEVAEKLWDLSCDLVKLEDKYFLPNKPTDKVSASSQKKCFNNTNPRINPVESAPN